jgi:tRNA threonylcarbamoyladenosine biosynthesis protein TsaE
MKEFRTFSANETVEVGFRLGSMLKVGDVVCLNGNLGTGKTALTTGIAKSLGISGYITSPTFTIVNEYNGKIPLYHFDAYRIADPDEMFEIGFEEYIEGNGVVVIEWADLIGEVLPQELIRVELMKDLQNGVDARIINAEFIGDKYIGYEEKF